MSRELVQTVSRFESCCRLSKESTRVFRSFTDDVIDSVTLTASNVCKEEGRESFEHARHTRGTDWAEIKIVLGVLYLAGVSESGRRNVSDLWNWNCAGIRVVYCILS